MADPKAAEPSKRVAVITPDGKFGTIDSKYADEVARAGGRVLSQQELKERELDAAYEKKSLGDKVVNAALGQGIGPRSEAFLESGRHVMSAGVSQAATRLAIDKVKPGAGAAYGEHLDDLETAHPDASTAGAAVGTIGQIASAFVGGGAGLARALPGAGVAALGAGAEGLAARGLGGLAARGIAGRAAATGLEMGVRGAVEGAALGGIEEASREVTHDPELSADKIFAGVGTGALFGAGTGAGLGVLGSLGKSAAGAAARSFARRGEAAATGLAERGAVASADEVVSKARPAPFIDPDAGLAGGKFAAESPIAIGAEMRPMQLRPGGAVRKVPTEPAFGLKRNLSIDPDAGLHAPEGKIGSPLDLPDALPNTREARRAAVEAGMTGNPVDQGVGLAPDIFSAAKLRAGGKPVMNTLEPSLIDAEAGIARRGQNGAFQGTIPTEPALRPSSAQNVPRRVGLDVGGEVPQLGGEASPIRFPAAAAAAEEAAPMVAPKSWLARKSDELAFDALGGTKGQMTKAVQHVKGGAEAVGEYVNRIHLAPAAAGADGMLGAATAAGKAGRADQLLEAIQADKSGRIAKGIGEAVNGTRARFDLHTLTEDVAKMHTDMMRDPTRVAGADAFLNRITEEVAAIGRTPGRIAKDGTIDAADAFYLRSSLEKKAYEVGGGTNSAAKDAYKTVLRQMDGHVVDTLDEAAASAGKNGVGDEIRKWKREWQLASAAEQVAEGGTERVRGNNTFGIRESIGGLVGLATGHPLLGMATAAAGKIARERGSAAGAQLLNHMSTSRGLASIVERVDAKMNMAAHGLLSEPAKRPLPFASESPRQVAQTAMRQVAAMQADPQGTAERLAAHVDQMSATHPELAQAIIARQTNALGFLASKAPTGGDPDPLDPHSAPRMSDADASTFAKFAFYSAKPERFFDELEHGKITAEGAETARALMPNAFSELQARMTDAIATHMARGRTVPFQQRLKIGSLIGIEATPSQKPEHMQFLQAGLAEQQNPKPPMPGGTAKMTMGAGNAQTSALDRLSGGLGRH